MKKISWIAVALFLIVVPTLYAAVSRDQSKQYVQGVVTDTQKVKIQFPDFTMGGSNLADAPLATRYYAYDVSICVSGQTHVGRYETVFNYSPFNPGQSVRLRLSKRVMYFDLPNYPDMRMRIIRRNAGCDLKR